MEKVKPYRESLRYRIANSKIGRMAMAVAMLPLAPITDPIARSKTPYSYEELREQGELVLTTANVHNEPLIQKINFFSNFEQANPRQILAEQQPDIACFQEISEEDALSLRDYGDVVFVSNNEYPFNGRVGIALVSRRKIEDVETPNLSSDKNRKRPAIIASIDNLRIACLHLTANKDLAQRELLNLMRTVKTLDALLGDLNTGAKLANAILGELAYSSRVDKPTFPRTGEAIDRIVLPEGSNILVANGDSDTIDIHSDHRGVVVKIQPSNPANATRKELK